MAALPYMQLYVADYFGDTYHLTTEEHGAFMLILMTYWMSGKPIPKKRLAAASRLSNERWTDVERTLNEFFTEDENECWCNKRMDADLKKVNAKSKQASEAGKLSGVKKAAKKRGISSKKEVAKHVQKQADATDVKRPLNGSTADAERTFNHTDTDTDTDKDTETDKNHTDTSTDLKQPENRPCTKNAVLDFAEQNGLVLDGFFDFYDERDWRVGEGSDRPLVRNWQKLARAWSKRGKSKAFDNEGMDNYSSASDDTSWRHNLGD